MCDFLSGHEVQEHPSRRPPVRTLEYDTLQNSLLTCASSADILRGRTRSPGPAIIFGRLDVHSHAKVWVYRAGFCRFSHARYSNATEDLEDMEKHLTNVAIQVHGALEACTLFPFEHVVLRKTSGIKPPEGAGSPSRPFHQTHLSPRFSAETHGELRQGVRRQVGNPAAQAAPDGVARRDRGEHPLPRDTVAYIAKPSIRAAGV